MKINIYVGLFLLLSLSSYAQIFQPCSEAPKDIGEISQLKITRQSSTAFNAASKNAVDGILQGSWQEGTISRTLQEQNPWWEIDLSTPHALESITIHFDSPTHQEGLSNYYLLFSDAPFGEVDLSTYLAQPWIDYLHINTALPNGYTLNLGYQTARYVRIQRAGSGALAFKEIIITGGQFGVESCNNGMDDDCDGRVDCEDVDCGAFIMNVDVSSHPPSCNICADGRIRVQSAGHHLEYSIDGGLTFQDSPIFEGVATGSYDIVVRNRVSGCQSEERVGISARRGTVNECCPNGGFEQGDLEGWTGGFGERDKDSSTLILINNRDFFTEDDPNWLFDDDAHHQILTPGYEDPVIPNLDLFNGAGEYIIRLGNRGSSRGADRLTYCFEVEECNQDFNFNYLFVLEQPMHPRLDNPYFQYAFLDQAGDTIGSTMRLLNGEDLPSGETIEGDSRKDNIDPNDPKEAVAYTFWECAGMDLSAYLGDTVCVEFIVVDCKDGAHFGYAYLDGLCKPPDEVTPQFNFTLEQNYCANQSIIIDALESFGFTEYSWKLCQVDQDSQLVACVEKELTRSDSLGILDLKALYGNDFPCDQDYYFELLLDNGCTDPVIYEQYFRFYCDEENEIDYVDFTNCLGEEADFQLQGTNDCIGCPTQWEPAQFLDDPTLSFPTVLGSENVNASRQRYTVEVTNQVGCIYRDTVQVRSIPDQELITWIEEDYCSYYLKAQLDFDQPVSKSLIEIEFFNRSANFSQSVFSDGEDTTAAASWVYTLPVSKNTIPEGLWEARAILNNSLQGNNCQEIKGELGYLAPTELFFGSFRFACFNAFTPNGDGKHELFFPVGRAFNVIGNMNAYHARFQIFSRWGTKVHDQELWGEEFDQYVDGIELAWDGYFNGALLPSDVYIFTLKLENCDQAFDNSGDCLKMCKCDPDIICTEDNQCPSEAWNGLFDCEQSCDGCNFDGDLFLIL